MSARRFKEKVQKENVRHVRNFAAFLGRSPDTATSEDLRRFQLHKAQSKPYRGTANDRRGARASGVLRPLPHHYPGRDQRHLGLDDSERLPMWPVLLIRRNCVGRVKCP